MVPSTSHSTCSAAKLGSGIGFGTGLRTVQIMHHAKQVQYMEPQEDHICLASVSPKPFDFSYRHFQLY